MLNATSNHPLFPFYLVPPYYVPEGDSPLSLQATAQLSRAVVSASASKHRAGVRATIPAVQVRGECSCGAGRGSLSARLGPHGWPEKLRLGQCKLETRPGGTPGPAVPCMLKKTLKGGFAPPALSTLSQFELLSVLGGPGAQAVRDCCRGRHGVVSSSVSVAWAKSLEPWG